MNNFVIENRVGTFSIADELIQTEPYEIMRVLSSVLIMRAERRWDIGATEYQAYSPYFEPQLHGNLPPVYKAIITTNRDEHDMSKINVDFKWELYEQLEFGGGVEFGHGRGGLP